MNTAAKSSAVRPRRSARRRLAGGIAAALADFPGERQRIDILSWNPVSFGDVAGGLGRRKALKSTIECRLYFRSCRRRSRGRRFDNDRNFALETAARADLTCNLAGLAAKYLLVKLGQLSGDGNAPLAEDGVNRQKRVFDAAGRLEENQGRSHGFEILQKFQPLYLFGREKAGEEK